ncbi:acyl-CoA-binding domain-containing protein 4 isoform X2 [Nothobranchius furzeri]|uniref:Acyl-CoA binding domain containing 4 n=1 Tax=Nothobranchius furzeri TaxID=105023 RepID=A0A1A8VFL4_NOTFU
MPVPGPAMAQPAVDHQTRFQAAVDVIHNLPKNGCYQPSYEVMLRFYSLYKQAMCGPCAVPRPGFWDPVGRYKWDAWNRLGDLSPESAMAMYVEEMKKVAQEVIDTMPMNHTTASFFHHFEPLYSVIGDMPRPPASLLTHVAGVRHEDTLSKMKADGEKQEGPDLHVELNMHEVVHLSPYSLPNESGIPEPLLITSDSESDIFCDSVDSVEQLSSMTIQASKSLSVYNGQEVCPGEGHHQLSHLEGRQAGAGQGGEGAEYRRGQRPPRGSREPGREACYRPAPTGEPRQAPQGGAGGSGQRGGDGSEGRAERLHDAYLQQQVILALRRLREDMGSVMERLEVVERLAASHVPGSEWRTCLQCAASQQEESWWPFDMSGPTVLLFLLWPFVAQGLVYMLKKAHQKGRTSL